MSSVYKKISNFGSSIKDTQSANPLTYCVPPALQSQFQHGAIAKTVSGKYSSNCESFMSEYCANNWNSVCEYMSRDKNTAYPNSIQRCGSVSQVACKNMTAGDVLIYNTAAKKYLAKMGGMCTLSYQPFDPTVASSPMVSRWETTCNQQGNGSCVPIYKVNPKTIDTDPIMNKILNKPRIAWDILLNIYNTMKRSGELKLLSRTKLGLYFNSNKFKNTLLARKLYKNKLNLKYC